MQKQKLKVIKKNKFTIQFWAGLLLAQFVLFYLLGRSEVVLKLHYDFFTAQKNIHVSIFSAIPFSVGDIFYTCLSIYLIYLAYRLISHRNKKETVKKIFTTINLLYCAYQVFWGLLYFQPSISSKLRKEQISDKEMKIFAEYLLSRCKDERAMVTEDENGVFTIKDIDHIQSIIQKTEQKIPVEFYPKQKNIPISSKSSLFSGIMSYTGILGYYNPFSAEAQYNKNLPSTALPFTIGHETAHQLGFAREQEANFISYLLCNESKQNELLYSAHFYTLKCLILEIKSRDPKYTQQIINNFSEGMKRDLEAERRFYKEHQSFLHILFEKTNDWFLKANQQEGSITYSYFTQLIMRYHKKELRFTTQFQKHK